MLELRSPGPPRLEESQPGGGSSPPPGVGVLQFQKVKKPLWGWESLFCCLEPGGGAGGCAEEVVGGLSLLWGLCLIPGRTGYTPYLRVPEHWTGCSGPSGSHSPLCRAQHQLTLALALPTICSSCPDVSRGSAVRVSVQGSEGSGGLCFTPILLPPRWLDWDPLQPPVPGTQEKPINLCETTWPGLPGGLPAGEKWPRAHWSGLGGVLTTAGLRASSHGRPRLAPSGELEPRSTVHFKPLVGSHGVPGSHP
uniref:uncharacterized protein LOC129496155 n=1 Tax=Nyctereutes procyonoides TaxID=34880 RepID=UPI002444D04F|nr:uncharacterized protein LOC129496155 [Nyctereutes procyonoides]